jgi:uncharacterized protein (TIGR02145 family)
VSKYRNGNSINVTPYSWNNWNDYSAKWCNYNNDANNDATYGKLYNFWAVENGDGLCPTGWHVPSDGEWNTLVTYLGGVSVAGGSLKSTAVGWALPNTGATNSSGFTGLPGGHRDAFGNFYTQGTEGIWWCSNPTIHRTLRNNDASVGYGNTPGGSTSSSRHYRYGFSVRCIKD